MTNRDSHHTLTYHHMRKLFIGIWLLGATVCQAQNLTLNDLDYFECQGVNVLVFSNPFNGGFNDEKKNDSRWVRQVHQGYIPRSKLALRLNTQYVIFGSSLKNIIQGK